MTCRHARGRLSAHLDNEVHGEEARELVSHLGSCEDCAERWRTLRDASEMLGDLPRLECGEPIAARVFDRLEVESRGPGLALLFRPRWKARPLILPSLVPAALVLVVVLGVSVALDRAPQTRAIAAWNWDSGLPPSGTEGNPLLLSSGVSVPRAREPRGPFVEDLLAPMGEGSLFLETVVARDGSVADVTVLEGDREQAQPFVDALRRERFEPGRYRGRAVAVSVYRLISRMEVRPPVT